MANQQALRELNREVDTLRSSLRKSYYQLVEQHLIAEVEQTKRLLQDRLNIVEEQKHLLESNDLPNSQSFIDLLRQGINGTP